MSSWLTSSAVVSRATSKTASVSDELVRGTLTASPAALVSFARADHGSSGTPGAHRTPRALLA